MKRFLIPIMLVVALLVSACGGAGVKPDVTCESGFAKTDVAGSSVGCLSADEAASWVHAVQTAAPNMIVTLGTATAPSATLAPIVAPATSGGTFCESLEQALMPAGATADKVGTENYPIAYPKGWGDNSCFGWTSHGTGAKYVVITGPAALQLGETTGPARMILVPEDKISRGWIQAAFGYKSETALEAQWKVENESAGKWGLICGYEHALKMEIPAYRWDESLGEVRDESLDCQIPLDRLLGKTSAAPNANPQATVAPATQQDYQLYSWVFKINVDNTNYVCGLQSVGVDIPATVVKVIEHYPKSQSDGNFAHDGGSNGVSHSGYCSGNAPNGNPWVTVILTNKGFVATSFPLH